MDLRRGAGMALKEYSQHYFYGCMFSIGAGSGVPVTLHRPTRSNKNHYIDQET
jgi:hypothetical protein